MAELHEMMNVVFEHYQEVKKTDPKRANLLLSVIGSLVDREKMLLESRVITALDKFLSSDNKKTVTLDVSDSGLKYVTLNNYFEGVENQQSFSSPESFVDALAQCVHTLNNEVKK